MRPEFKFPILGIWWCQPKGPPRTSRSGDENVHARDSFVTQALSKVTLWLNDLKTLIEAN